MRVGALRGSGSGNVHSIAAAGALAVGAAGSEVLPATECLVTVVTGTLHVALWVEEGMLVQRDALLGVRSAEDVAALAAVVSTIEEREWRMTARLSADGSRRVVLPVHTGDWSGHGR